jgi:ABC-type transport system involved in cytochrome c biogenesis permease subunit
MPPVHPDLAAAAHPWLAGLLWAAAGVYALSAAAAVLRPALARPALALGAGLHLAGTVARGLAIDFFPLTNKMESFSAAALATALVAAVAFRPERAYLLPLLCVLGAAMAAALAFPGDLRWPPPLMRTIWYPLHIPLSFLAYACWAAAAAAGVAWWARRDGEWLGLVDRLALWGFALWSLSMVTGGIWGVLAWGAYFLWDPKVIWSVILWFHYSAFVHVKLTPSLAGRAWARPTLAAVGFVFVLIAYVGTSFFFGRSSHAFG